MSASTLHARTALILCAAAIGFSALGCAEETTPAPARGSDKGASAADEDDEQEPTDKAPVSTKPRADAGGSKAPVAEGSDEPGDQAGAAEPGDKTPGSASLWCNALAVFQDSCQSCHGAPLKAGAPMALLTYADATAAAPVSKGQTVAAAVKARVHDVKKPMPPGAPLDAKALAAIDAWVADGAKPGDDATCAGQIAEKPPVEEAAWPPPGCDESFKITAGKGSKVTVQNGTETHPQVILDAPWGDKDVQAVGFRPITDNSAVLHHWILNSNVGAGAFINGWAPGKDESKRKPYPDDVGVFLPKGKSALRLDMHYNNLTGTKPELDDSGVEVCVTHTPRKFAATTFSGFAAIPRIPAGQEIDIVGTCNVAVKQPTYLISESPHAHQLATHMKLVVKRGSEEIVLHDAPFAFDGQVATQLPEPFELKNGDVVTTTCHYKNDTNKVVGFGEDTGNEMCFNFVVYYPMGSLSCSRAAR